MTASCRHPSIIRKRGLSVQGPHRWLRVREAIRNRASIADSVVRLCASHPPAFPQSQMLGRFDVDWSLFRVHAQMMIAPKRMNLQHSGSFSNSLDRNKEDPITLTPLRFRALSFSIPCSSTNTTPERSSTVFLP